MANYTATCRSNYFRVKDPEAFKAWTLNYNISVVERDGPMFAIFGEDPDGAGWPTSRWDEDADNPVDVEFDTELAEHLEEDSIAILMEVGNEKRRYVIGQAIAVNSRNETVYLDLSGIYDLARKRFGDEVEITKVGM